MSLNTTHVSSSASSSLSYNVTADNISSRTPGRGYVPENNLGYGLGKIVREVLDHLWHTWQGISAQAPSEELNAKRQIAICRKGLQKFVEQLEKALEHLRTNPRDPSALKKIESLAHHYAVYLTPSNNDEELTLQLKVFHQLKVKIARITQPHLKATLQQILPIEKTYAKRALQQASSWPASFDLTTLNGANGFAIPGIAAGDQLGISVSTAGDINGDGKADLVLGAYGVSFNTGAAYAIFGQVSGWPASFNLSTLNGTNGFAIPAIVAGGELGSSVSTAGDLNGDGKADLVLGAYYVSSNTGEAYVIFGQAGGWTPSFNFSTLDGTNGFAIHAIAAGGRLGKSVSTGGDINGDGRADLILGADSVSSGTGEAYVIFGKASGWPSSFTLSILNGTNGFAIPGIAANGQLGYSVSTAGDINGDGKADLVLGAPVASSQTGEAYVIFGKASGWPASFNLTTLNGTNGFAIPGIAAGDELGISVSTAGDLNGDGKADLVLGAPDASSQTGEAYVIFGQASGWPASFNLATLNGINGFAIPGILSGGYLGYSVSTAGDINGDGKADLVLGAFNVFSGTGEAYVIFGKANGWPASFNLTTLNGTNGFTIPGIAVGLGSSVSTAGDINSDGKADLVLGAYDVSSSTGEAYVIFGMNASAIAVTSPTPSLPSPTSLSPTQPSSTTSPQPGITLTATLPSPASGPIVQPPGTPTPMRISSPESSSTIGIAAGVGGAVLLGGIIGIVVFLRFKKKACFAYMGGASPQSRRPNLEQGFETSNQALMNSLFIPKNDLKQGKKIAEGNFGDVFKGTYQNRDVAIKQLRGQLSSEVETKLFEEVKIMAGLRSPYVVTFYGVTKDQPYMIVMEYMEGGALRDFLKKQSPERTSWDLRLQISHDISQGLKYLHGKNIVHADLKSLNVLLDKKNHAKLADFGLASVKNENMEQYYQDASQVQGSLLWMAPELFNRGRHTYQTDIYSLGVVLWEIASHQLPFQEEKWGAGEMIAQITQGTREKFPQGTPESYEKLGERCWGSSPTKRPFAEEAARILSELWKGKKGDEGYEEISVGSSSSKEPSYLTGTTYDGQKAETKKPAYLENEQTRFGI